MLTYRSHVDERNWGIFRWPWEKVRSRSPGK
jgi:hypothetical protein